MVVYGLIDPRTEAVRYVGKAVSLDRRLRNHSKQSRYEASPKAAWLRDLRAENLKPKHIILEHATEETWDTIERRWIAILSELGAPLLNEKKGGQAGCATRPEVRAKISASNKGKGHSPEWRAQHAETMRGRKYSAEHRAKMGAAHKGNQNARRYGFILTNPQGEQSIVDGLVSMVSFCSANGLDVSSMRKVAAGKVRKSRSGWKCSNYAAGAAKSAVVLDSMMD